MKKKITILILILILILIILFIFLFSNKEKRNNQFQDDILFFKLFSFWNNQPTEYFKKNEQVVSKIVFDVSYKNIDFKTINLVNTINKNTLIHEKIAPGTSGKFEIELKANQKINYQINFKSENEKPENLVFKIEGKDKKYKTLEEIGQELKGKIDKNKNIFIDWQWEYEVNSFQNKQDTKDGEKLKQYTFKIYAIGYK